MSGCEGVEAKVLRCETKVWRCEVGQLEEWVERKVGRSVILRIITDR